MRTKTILTLIIALVIIAICAGPANAIETKIYYIFNSLIDGDTFLFKCNLDGSSNQPFDGYLTEGWQGRGIGLDIPSGKVYFSDNTNGRINRAGGGQAYGIVTGIYYPTDIEIDTCAGKMYWYDAHWDQPGNSKIQRANLDGSNVEILLTSISASTVSGIALDVPNGKIYWTTVSDIYRSNLDGTVVEKILTVSSGELEHLDLNLSAGKMYWVNLNNEQFPGSGEIQRANIDGSTQEDIVTGETMPEGIALDAVAGKVYWSCPWTNPPTIRRANIDGTNVETVLAQSFPFIGRIRDIELAATPASLTMGVAPVGGGTTVPNTGPTAVSIGIPTSIAVQSNVGYVFNGWTANPPTNALFANANSPSTTVAIWNNTTVTANFSQLPQYELTMAVSPSAGGITTPSVGTTMVFQGIPKPIIAQANAGYTFMSWTAIPSGNVLLGNAGSPSTTAILSGDAAVTANFNAKPVADINATVNVLVITDANSVTLDATGSTDDGLPNPPGVLTYFWEKGTGPNKCSISDPNAAVTEVSFSGTGVFEFRLTVSDGQSEDTQLIAITVVLDVAYISTTGNDDMGLGTATSPFATIQKGIDVVRDNGIVIALTGTYYGNIDFAGKKVCVRSSNPDDPNIVANTVIDASGSGTVVTFASAEDANSILSGFKITGGSAEYGGGIYIKDASPVIEKNIITGNYASSIGGGLYAENDSATIQLNAFTDNETEWTTVTLNNSSGTFINNFVIDNLSTGYDAGLWCDRGQPLVKNNTIANNETYDELYDSSTGILLSYDNPATSAIITNNIIGGNVNGCGIYNWSGGTIDPNRFTYNNVYGHSNKNYFGIADQTGTYGNTSLDPQFVDTFNNDFHLRSESLLIDAGDPSSDWSNEPRPNGGRINMGAYGNTSEASCSVAGDITWDKKVNFKDFAKLASYWLQNEPSVDIAPLVSGDNIVDIGDLMVLAEHWLEGI